MNHLKKSTNYLLLKQYAQEVIEFDFRNDHFGNYKLHSEHLEINYNCQRATPEILNVLFNLASECKLEEKIRALIQGERVNTSQNIPALHTALRVAEPSLLLVNELDVMPDILIVREKMRLISEQIHSGEWLGYSGKKITNIINIGIGGSDFGPRFCLNALKDYVLSGVDYRFISDVDPRAFQEAIKNLNPETTLFIISSKSFTTYETLYNAKKAMDWFDGQNIDNHFIAVTANRKKAEELGISNILPIWNWVGGRYSLCSAINLITCIAIGYNFFMEFLAGAHSMDLHFQKQDFHENMPVILGLLGVWNINFLSMSNLLIQVYGRQLELLVPYIQQLDMESNGKGFDTSEHKVDYATGPIVWGGMGNQAQHSYYQLLSQSNHKVAADFISLKEYDEEPINRFCAEQIHVLSQGASSINNPSGTISGGMPITHIKLKACKPSNLGALIALYEHKIYVQSVLWNINPFDQPGVESAKIMNRRLKK